MDETLQALIDALRDDESIDAVESTERLVDYIRAQKADAWDDGVSEGMQVEYSLKQTPNPYGAGVPECTCGFGGFHDDINPRCARNQK